MLDLVLQTPLNKELQMRNILVVGVSPIEILSMASGGNGTCISHTCTNPWRINGTRPWNFRMSMRLHGSLEMIRSTLPSATCFTSNKVPVSVRDAGQAARKQHRLCCQRRGSALWAAAVGLWCLTSSCSTVRNKTRVMMMCPDFFFMMRWGRPGNWGSPGFVLKTRFIHHTQTVWSCSTPCALEVSCSVSPEYQGAKLKATGNGGAFAKITPVSSATKFLADKYFLFFGVHTGTTMAKFQTPFPACIKWR